MEKAASVFLRSDITLNDINSLIGWLENNEVTRYLSDDFTSTEYLRELSDQVPEHLLSLNLNRDGLFYIIDASFDDDDEQTPIPVGFVRLSEFALRRYELVFAVGSEDLWGLGIGTAAANQALAIAFFEQRAEIVRARIMRGNLPSQRVITKCGMLPGYDGGKLMEYNLSFRQYLSHIEKMRAQ
jgi:Acetyltransferases, including N-acetylases of ribosomal proteins